MITGRSSLEHDRRLRGDPYDPHRPSAQRRLVFLRTIPPLTQRAIPAFRLRSRIGGWRPATSFCCRNEWRQHSPLGIGQISRITCQDHNPRLYPDRQIVTPRPLFRQALSNFCDDSRHTKDTLQFLITREITHLYGLHAGLRLALGENELREEKEVTARRGEERSFFLYNHQGRPRYLDLRIRDCMMTCELAGA